MSDPASPSISAYMDVDAQQGVVSFRLGHDRRFTESITPKYFDNGDVLEGFEAILS
jgi:hypothetical protein